MIRSHSDLGPNASMPDQNAMEDILDMAAYEDAIAAIGRSECEADQLEYENEFFDHDSSFRLPGDTEVHEMRPFDQITENSLLADLCGHGAESVDLERIDWEA